ncbi:MAG: sugar ABC transporter permease [Chloroflexota bacterium]|nr:MAG: sugar ABC transporter permease [Chloroflexota bacterium]
MDKAVIDERLFIRRGGWQRKWQTIYGVIFLSPWLIGFIVFKLVPILFSLYYSFTDFHLLHPDETQFIGLENYLNVIRDENAGFTIFFTIGLGMVSIPAQLLLSLFLAWLLTNTRTKGKMLMRTLFFIPAIIPGVAIFSIWLGFFNPSTGWINQLIMEPLGLPPVGSIYSESSYNMLITGMLLWSIGPSFIIMLGSMNSVPEELYEAARVDGAGPMMRFWGITVPMISPAILFSIVISLIGLFGGTLLLDPGNPFTGGVSIFDNYISNVMFQQFEMGYAAALAWIFFALMLLGTITLFKTSGRWVYYPENQEEEDF